MLKSIRNIHGKLTIGKTYKIIEEGKIGDIPVYYITLDSGFKEWTTITNFIRVEDLREDKLKQLGIR